ncbi:hypothetical protein [Streptomyces sp. CC224B]|uniref:hypothetical protein n=1 Tax=Streptomyces sp. CC224B TaxID=3044571 RepID=UPI0024A9C5E1|nr:hypothetical protein [Streptomyces sp. CC224B]
MPAAVRRDRHIDTAAAESPSPLDVARKGFDHLVTGTEPLSLDCRGLEGLPDRCVALDELLDRLLHGPCPQEVKDYVWCVLVERSRTVGATWALACAGMALPALANVAKRLAARHSAEPYDVHAEVLLGFLTALITVDLSQPHIVVRLKWAAYRRGLAALTAALDAPVPVEISRFAAAPSEPPAGHPDLVLARAVRAGVLTRTEADLIGRTRLEGESVSDWAGEHHLTLASVYKARRRAEQRLVALMRDEDRTAKVRDAAARGSATRRSRSAPSRPDRRALRSSLSVLLMTGCPKASAEPVSSGAGAPP